MDRAGSRLALRHRRSRSLRPGGRVALRESTGLGFVVALQVLSPRQRAALLLVDVVGWRVSEVAELLETSVASVNSLLQRARHRMQVHRAAGRETTPRLDAPHERALLRRFIAAWERGDIDALASLLAEDAVLSMPPEPQWFRGREAIRRFLQDVPPAHPGQYRLLPTRANGLPAAAVYRRDDAASAHRGVAIVVVGAAHDEIALVVRFGAPSLFASFGLRLELEQQLSA